MSDQILKSLFPSRKLYFAFFITIWLSLSLSYSQCHHNNTAYQSGENLQYEVVYNWGKIWIAAASVSFRVNAAEYMNKKSYQCIMTASSYKNFDWLYKVRDFFQTYIDSATMRPLNYTQSTYEGGHIARNNYRFDYSKNHIYTYTSTSLIPLKYDTFKTDGCIFDVVSAVYQLRNINFALLKPGEPFSIKAIIDGTTYPINLRYIGKETLVTHDGKKYHCLKITACLVEGTIFKSGENVIAYVTDDENKIAIMVEAQILIGTVKAVLKSADNLRSPFSSKID
jgi:hypothetical protein